VTTNIIVESCDVTFNKTAPCPHDVFECACDKKIEESIFVNEELHGFDRDEDEPLPLPHLKQRHLRLLPLPQQ
jgi:uncharacterized protein YcgI (DUF1989 family)